MTSNFTASGDGLKRLAELGRRLGRRPAVRIGVFKGSEGGEEHSGDGAITNLALATIHEFGAEKAGIPERSFLRGTADARREEWFTLLERALGKVVQMKIQLEPALELVGLRASADIRKAIVSGSGIEPALAPATVAAKGSSRPLVDTGQLINSLTHVVDKA